MMATPCTFFLVFAVYFLGGVDGLKKLLTTSGRDVSYEVTLSQKLNLYGEYHTSLFVHSRGFLALGKKDVRRVDINRFQQNKLLVPYYNEIYLRKTVQIETTSDPNRLQQFSNKVKTHFSDETKFEAKELLSIAWNVYTQFSNASMQTITLLLGSGGDRTYILLTYSRSQSVLYRNFLDFVYGTSIAGFSAGDGVRYHEIFGNYANELFTEKLAKLSNIGSPGNWMFKLGDVGGSNKNFAVKSADRRLHEGNMVDNDECAQGVSQCHKAATCSNRNMGYICQCDPQYIGNGNICLKKDSSVYVRGYINGQVNGHEIYDSDHTILVQPSGGVDVTVIPLKEELGNVFRALPMIHGLIPWLFAKSDAAVYGKGFDIVGDHTIAKTLINFVGDPSELYITQKIKGIANGALALVTTITGNTPEFGQIKKIELTNITEVFQEGSIGSTSSISLSNIIVNGKTYGVKVSRLIIYDPSLKKMNDLKHELHMDFNAPTYSSYSTRSGLYMKFDAYIKNLKDQSISCIERPCGTNANCVGNRARGFTCQCKTGYLMQASKCVLQPPKITCRAKPCGVNSQCEDTTDGFICKCKPGFGEKASTCIDIDECTRQPCSHLKHMKCVNIAGSYKCQCNQGFNRTGDACIPSNLCMLSPCGANSNCVAKGGRAFKCECKDGYEKEGANCVDVDECQKTSRCDGFKNTKCVNKDGSFSCECRNGYKKGTDGGCSDVNECELEKPCSHIKNSNCVNRPGSYRCSCKPGYKRTSRGCEEEQRKPQRTCRDNPCGDNSRCVDVDGSFKCDCLSGFVRIDSNCTDVNECLSDVKACSHVPNTVCENIVGSYLCSCKPGYLKTTRGCEGMQHSPQRTCGDNPCGDNSRCVDVEGSFRCDCVSGFAKIDSECVDVNECESGRMCSHIKNSICANTQGSYRCTCRPGYRRTARGCEREQHSPQRTCGDNPCGDNSRCVDADGGFSCACKEGFRKVDSNCIDVNECVSDRVCTQTANTVCENTRGSYRCVCRPGYKKIASRCEVDNKCYNNPCGKHAECVDLGNTYACKCNPGFRKKGSRCVDIDECETYGMCKQYRNTQCMNRPGSFDCGCLKGYKKANDGSCKDIDECYAKDICKSKVNTRCVNTEASYTCSCISGYVKKGGKCVVDISTCNCKANQECYNVRGQNFCRCKKGYEWEEGKCIDVDECRSGNFKCMDNGRCVNTVGSYICKCNAGYTGKPTSTGEQCINFARFKGTWSISISGKNVDVYTIGNDGKISVKSRGGRVTASLAPSNDTTATFPYNDGWFEASNARIPGSREFIRLKEDNVLEVHHFCKLPLICNRNFGAIRGGYCCAGSGIKEVEDVDECKSGTHKCPLNTNCVNTDGSYECVCKVGYKKNTKGECKDLDECSYNICGRQAECTNTIGGFTCRCYQGFHQTTGNICTDIDECAVKKEEACGKHATCVNIEGGYKCDCPINYVFASNGKDCEKACTRCFNGGKCVGINQCQCAQGYSGDWCQFKAKDDFLLFAQSGLIKRLSYPYRKKHFGYLHTAYGNNLIGTDYDCKDKLAYYSDNTAGEIVRLTYNGLNRKVILKDLKGPEGLSIDWVGRNVFWVESFAQTINVATLDGYYAKTLFQNNIGKARAITNNPFTGKLYWSDWERSNPRIECSNMDGSKREVFANSKELKTPNGIALNYAHDELCWTDAGKNQIACKHLKSGNVRVLVTQVHRPFALTFHKEHMFWTDWVGDEIQKYSLKNNKRSNGLQTGISYDGRLYDIKSVQPCPKVCEEVGFDYLQYDFVLEFKNMTSSSNCRSKCKVDNRCKYWSWHSKTNICQLKDDNNNRQVKEGVVSGAKDCQIAPWNPCATKKGGCKYLCLMSGPSTRKCVSPDRIGFTFNETE